MKAGSGDTVKGGDIKLCATVDGRSLDMLRALDREEGILWGEAMPEEDRGAAGSIEEYMSTVSGSGGSNNNGGIGCSFQTAGPLLLLLPLY